MARAHQITSLQAPVRVIEDGLTLETSDLAGPFAAFGPDVVDEPSVSAERVRSDFAESLSRFMNCLSLHRSLRSFERRLFV